MSLTVGSLRRDLEAKTAEISELRSQLHQQRAQHAKELQDLRASSTGSPALSRSGSRPKSVQFSAVCTAVTFPDNPVEVSHSPCTINIEDQDTVEGGRDGVRQHLQIVLKEKLALEWKFSKLYKKYDRAHRDKVVLVTRVESLERELATAKEKNPNAASKLEDAARIQELEKQLDELNGKLASQAEHTQQELDAFQALSRQDLVLKLAETEDALQAKQIETARLKARMSALQDADAAAAKAAHERDEALSQIAQLQAALDDKIGASTENVQALNSMTPDQLKRLVLATRRRAEVLELDAQQLRAVEMQLHRQLFDAQAKLGETRAERDVILETSTARVDAIQRRLFEAETHCDANHTLTQLKLENQDLHAQVRGHAETLAELNQRLNALRKERDAAMMAAAEGNAKLNTIEQRNISVQQQNKELLAQIARSSQDNMDGCAAVLETLRQQLEQSAIALEEMAVTKATLQTTLQMHQQERQSLSGALVAIAAQRARADRLQAALGFIDDVPTSASGDEIISSETDHSKAPANKSLPEEASLTERIAAALEQANASAGICPRRRIAHLAWRQGDGSQAEPGADMNLLQQQLAAAQWRAAAEQSNARRLAVQAQNDMSVQQRRETAILDELAAAQGREQTHKTRLLHSLQAQEALLGQNSASSELFRIEAERYDWEQQAHQLKQQVDSLLRKQANLREAEEAARADAAAAVKQMAVAQADAATARDDLKKLRSRQPSINGSSAMGRAASGKPLAPSPLTTAVSAEDLLASANTLDAGTLAKQVAELEHHLHQEKLKAADLRARLTVAEDQIAHLQLSETHAQNEKLNNGRLEREVQRLRKQLATSKTTGTDDSAAASFESRITDLESDLRHRDTAAQEATQRFQAEKAQLEAQLGSALDRVTRMEERLLRLHRGADEERQHALAERDSLHAELDEVRHDLTGVLRELAETQQRLREALSKLEQTQKHDMGGSLSFESANHDEQALLGQQEISVMKTIVSQAQRTADLFSAELKANPAVTQATTAQAGQVILALEQIQGILEGAKISQDAVSSGRYESLVVEAQQRWSDGEKTSSESQRYQDELRIARDELHAARQEVDKLTEDNDLLAQEVEARQAEVEHLKRNMHEIAQQAALTGAATVPKADYRQLQEVLRDTERRLHEQEKAAAALQATADALQNRVELADQHKTAAEREKTEIQAKLMAAELELSRLRGSDDHSRVKELEDLIKTLSEDVSAGHKKQMELRQELETKEEELHQLHQELRQIRLEKELSDDRHNRLETNASDLHEENSRLRASNHDLLDEVDAAKRRIQELEDELHLLRAAIARFLGVSEEQITVAYLTSLSPLQNSALIDRELLQRVGDPHIRAVLSGQGSLDDVHRGQAHSRNAWTPESGRYLHLRDGSTSRPGSSVSSQYPDYLRGEGSRPESVVSDASRQNQRGSQKPRTYPRQCVAIYDHTPPSDGAENELSLRRGDLVTAHGPAQRNGLQEATVRGKRGLVPASHLKEMSGSAGPRTRLMQQLAGHAPRSHAQKHDEDTETIGTGSMAFPLGAAKVMRARHNFHPSELETSALSPEDQLPFQKSDLLTVNVGAIRDDGFVKAVAEDGDMGYVPLAFLEDVDAVGRSRGTGSTATPLAEPVNEHLLPGQPYQERLGGIARPQEHFHVPEDLRSRQGGVANGSATQEPVASQPFTPRTEESSAPQEGGDGLQHHQVVRPMSRDALDSVIRPRPSSKKRSGLAKLFFGSPKTKYTPSVGPMTLP
eukprot:m.237591 g.237591  ORF g.237591 m.237591 type:complete len:1756 (+) comp17111_c0_seq1:93-5360(+)